jgi:hypothetical protein
MDAIEQLSYLLFLKRLGDAENQAEHLFQTLLRRAFRGELGGDPKGFGNP